MPRRDQADVTCIIRHLATTDEGLSSRRRYADDARLEYVSDPRLSYTVCMIGYGGYTVAGVLYSRKARKRDTSGE